MNGRRVPMDADGDLHYWKFAPGDYGKNADGVWYARCPPDTAELIANLRNHSVVEHPDGTITVSPSILCTGSDGQWHGWLERGIWRA